MFLIQFCSSSPITECRPKSTELFQWWWFYQNAKLVLKKKGFFFLVKLKKKGLSLLIGATRIYFPTFLHVPRPHFARVNFVKTSTRKPLKTLPHSPPQRVGVRNPTLALGFVESSIAEKTRNTIETKRCCVWFWLADGSLEWVREREKSRS